MFISRWFCVISLLLSLKLGAETDTITIRKIKQAIKKAEFFLAHIQQANGLISDTLNPLFNLWETTLAANALNYDNKDTTIKHAVTKAYKAIIRLSGFDYNKKLICHNTKCKALYCVETSALFQLFAVSYGSNSINDKSKLALKNLQKSSGEWEIGNPDVLAQKTFPSVTAFALWSLEVNKLKPKFEKEAFQFLVHQQKTDGSWGQAWEYYNTPAYALWVILSLHQFKKDYPKNCKAAYQFIYKNQNLDGSWYYHDSSNVKNTSSELQTSLMLLCLLNDEVSSTNQLAIAKAITFLVSHQTTNGSWDGGYFPINNVRYEKKEYVMATSQILLALKRYLISKG
jgi:squalene cyclase